MSYVDVGLDWWVVRVRRRRTRGRPVKVGRSFGWKNKDGWHRNSSSLPSFTGTSDFPDILSDRETLMSTGGPVLDLPRVAVPLCTSVRVETGTRRTRDEPQRGLAETFRTPLWTTRETYERRCTPVYREGKEGALCRVPL